MNCVGISIRWQWMPLLLPLPLLMFGFCLTVYFSRISPRKAWLPLFTRWMARPSCHPSNSIEALKEQHSPTTCESCETSESTQCESTRCENVNHSSHFLGSHFFDTEFQMCSCDSHVVGIYCCSVSALMLLHRLNMWIPWNMWIKQMWIKVVWKCESIFTLPWFRISNVSRDSHVVGIVLSVPWRCWMGEKCESCETCESMRQRLTDDYRTKWLGIYHQVSTWHQTTAKL